MYQNKLNISYFYFISFNSVKFFSALLNTVIRRMHYGDISSKLLVTWWLEDLLDKSNHAKTGFLCREDPTT